MFLVGLEISLDQVSSSTTSPLQSLEEAYSQVYREVQMQVSMDTEGHNEASSLLVQKNRTRLNHSLTNSASQDCLYCNSNRHILDIFWKKHGYLE